MHVPNHETAQHGDSTKPAFDDAVDPRNQALRDGMWKGHGGWEIAFTPVIFGIAGWTLDGYVGIAPALTIVFVIVGLFGSIANQYYRYQAAMEAATAERMARIASKSAANSDGDVGRPFGPVEYVEPDMSIDFSKLDNTGDTVDTFDTERAAS